jgi:hypothetical protein
MGMQMGMKTATPMGSHTGSHTGEPKKGTRNVKTVFVAMLLATAMVSPSSAANWFNPDGTKTPGAARVIARGLPAVGSVPFRELSAPDYESRTVITSPFGTSDYRYRSYRR